MRVIAHVERSLDGAIIAESPLQLFLAWVRAKRTRPRRAEARFTPEAEAQRQTLGPRLPHHRHRMTADEFLAGIILWTVIAGSALYIGVRFL